jgi:glyoxylate reductase
MARVVVTRSLPFPALDRLRAAHDVVEGGTWRDAIHDAEGLLCLLTEQVDAEVLDAAPKLRVISNYAVGADNIDVEEARRRGIAVGVTPGVLTDATADLTIALMLNASRRVDEAARDARNGRWQTWEPAGWLGLELRRATIAIVGWGRIGKAVAERAGAFGMEVVPVGRDDGWEVAARADVVSLHVPLTAETRGMVGAAELSAMKPGAILINTARGALVDTDALVDWLQQRKGAAALDVTDPEPLPPGHPLYDLPNALVVPHIGSATHTARARMAEAAVDNLLAGLEGRPLPNPAK